MNNHLRIASRATCLIVNVLIFCAVLSAQKTDVLLADESRGRQELLSPYEQRVATVEEQHSLRMATTQQEIPPEFEPWWSQYLDRPLWESSRALTIDIGALVIGAIKHSPKVLALGIAPEIQKTDICAAEAIFDSRTFLESKFIRTSDPVASLLTVGYENVNRFRDQNWYFSGGIRRKTGLGGQFEMSQRFGMEDNNSFYYAEVPDVPLPQGTAKLSLSYTQPLLNGAGRAYNESVIVLAIISAGVAADQFAAELQNHLLEVNKAYWTLYLQRVSLLEKRRLLQEAEDILGDLDARKNFDANGGQIVRAKAAVESRRASLIRYEAGVHNAEARIHLLVNDPQLFIPDRAELVPIQHPQLQYPNIGVRDSLLMALYNRPEINQSLQEIRAACVREQIATKDLLPVLDAVLSTYASGLRGTARMGKAWFDQFSVGEPTYTAGLQFELPLGNRAAKARLLKRQLELQQFSLKLRQTVAVMVEEIEVAVRDVDAAFREAQAQYLAMQAAASEIKYLESRWRLLPSEEQVAGIVLEDLLAAQERCGNAEIGFASAQVGYNLALANLNRATGVLLKYIDEPSLNNPVAPPNDIEEVPLPPSDVSAPLPPPVSNVPPAAPSGNSTSNTPPQTNANVNHVTENVGKPQPAPLPPAVTNIPAAVSSGNSESNTPPQANANVSRVMKNGGQSQAAPLPPAVSNLPAAASSDGIAASTAPPQANANVSRVTKKGGQSPAAPLQAKKTRSRKASAEANPSSSAKALAPLPPPINNAPTTAMATTPTETIRQ